MLGRRLNRVPNERRRSWALAYFGLLLPVAGVILNYYRLEAGRFEDFVSYGLKSFAHEGVTRKLSSPSLGSVPS